MRTVGQKSWRSNLVGNGWEVCESDDYLRGVAQCGGAEAVDAAIAPIIYTLYKNPLAHPETDLPHIRLARTRLRINGPDVILSHSVWFRANESLREVELLWVEYTDPNEME